MVPRLYLTGVFYFIMMYTGSNIHPIARFLKQTHMFQSYVSDQGDSRSILSPMLPKAMVCYLENHGEWQCRAGVWSGLALWRAALFLSRDLVVCLSGPEKFAQIFLGEFDTPEAIWGSEMRRSMIEKLSMHIADFTPRLTSNHRALYQYCPISKISYPELEDEIFCNIYYLKHLCNEAKFPEWPIRNHVEVAWCGGWGLCRCCCPYPICSPLWYFPPLFPAFSFSKTFSSPGKWRRKRSPTPCRWTMPTPSWVSIPRRDPTMPALSARRTLKCP